MTQVTAVDAYWLGMSDFSLHLRTSTYSNLLISGTRLSFLLRQGEELRRCWITTTIRPRVLKEGRVGDGDGKAARRVRAVYSVLLCTRALTR